MGWDIYDEARRVSKRFMKPVIIDGEYFESYAKAARKYGTFTSTIAYAVKNNGMIKGKKVEKVDKTLVKQSLN